MNRAKIITIEKIRYLEEQANKGGLGYSEMMENAGKGTAKVVRHRVGARDKRIVILTGPGNNGGDGLVAAHYLKEMGARVSCYIWKRKIEGDANFERVSTAGIPIIWAEDDADYEALQGLVGDADVIVDALLGVGVSRPITGQLKEILSLIYDLVTNRNLVPEIAESIPSAPNCTPLVVAVDCPTGLDCDSGQLDPAALPADITVTFAHPKVGLLRFPGAEAVGEILVVDIAIPPELAADVPLEMATAALVRSWLPTRSHSGHKGTFGRALIVAGSVHYVGAATLAGAGAKRIGTGLVTMAVPTPIQPAVAANLTEATFLVLPHDMGVISPGAVRVLQESLSDYDALLLGPGLTREKETVAFVHTLLGLEEPDRKSHIGFITSTSEQEQAQAPLPSLVVDADGLNALATAREWWHTLPPHTILTPHPGEMARLMGGDITTREIQAERETIAQQMAETWNVVLVLKGAFTVVAAPGRQTMVLPFANPGLATAGSGDVLAGAIVGLCAQGMKAFEAAVAGAYVHGLAGELARSDLGDMGMVAGDLPPRLPLALRRIR